MHQHSVTLMQKLKDNLKYKKIYISFPYSLVYVINCKAFFFIWIIICVEINLPKITDMGKNMNIQKMLIHTIL